MTEPLETTATAQRPYPEEFKREAVELLRTSGQPLAQVARELGVSPESLRLWRKRAQIDADEREALVSAQSEQPRRLRHENHKLKRTRIWVSLAVIVVAVAALVVTLLLALAGGDADSGTAADPAGQPPPPQTARAVDGSFVGKVSGMKAFVAVVAAPAEGERNERAVQVYVADGNRINEWFSGSISNNSFLAKSEDGDAEAEGKLRGGSVKGTVELPNGKTVRYKASLPAGAAGLYDLTVSARGKLSGVSAAGLGVSGRIELLEGTGVLRLADGQRLEFAIADDSVGDLIRLRPGQVRLIVLPSGKLVGAGKSRPTEDSPQKAFFIIG
jgi:transposase